MPWLKLSDDFGLDCADLSDAAFRTHVEGLLWTMARLTGGRLTPRDVRRFAETGEPPAAIAELLAAGRWRGSAENGYVIVHAMDVQVEPEVVAAKRANDAARQRKHRRKAAGVTEEPDDVTRDVTRDATRDPGLVGTGRDGQLRPEEGTSLTHARARKGAWRCACGRPRDLGFDHCRECGSSYAAAMVRADSKESR